jgi:hypothetical protein
VSAVGRIAVVAQRRSLIQVAVAWFDLERFALGLRADRWNDARCSGAAGRLTAAFLGADQQNHAKHYENGD